MNNFSDKAPSLVETLVYSLLVLCFLVPGCSLEIFSFMLKPEDLPPIDYGALWFPETPLPLLIVSSFVSFYLKITRC